MRWTILFAMCVAVASAMYGKKSRVGQMLHKVASLGNEIGHDLEDSWSEEDSDEETEDDDVWQQPQRHHYHPRHKNQKPYRTHTEKGKWNPNEEDEFETQDDDEYTQVQPKKKQHRRREWEDDEQKEPCHPEYGLLQKLSQVNVQMAAKLHRETKQTDDDKNTVVSPVVVQLALASVAEGARGNTKRQLNQLLDFGLPKNQYRNAYAALIRSLKGLGPNQDDSKAAQIKCTTSLVLGQQSAQEQFLETIKTCFDGEVKKCQFRQKTQACRDQINQWVASKAGLKSLTVLSPTAVSGTTKMLSIGTMQVKANWGKQFRKNLKTVPGQFYPLGEQQPSTIKTLQTEGDFNYFEDEQMQVLGVPTQEKQLTMYVLLPKDRHGLSHLEKHHIQYGTQLQQVLDLCDARKHPVSVQLPNFQATYTMDAKQMLRKLGVEDAFDGAEADFSGVNDETVEEEVLEYGRRQTGGLEDIDVKKASKQYKQQHQLHLNKLIQYATIRVDEHGIDAANGAHSTLKSKPNDDEEREDYETGSSKTFKADHAFSFIIKHNPSNQLLLIGRVVDAGQKADTDTERD